MRMWGSGRFSIQRPLRLGETAEKRSLIRAVEFKEGRTGAPVFVTIEHLTTQGDYPCIIEEQTLVYRAAPTGRVSMLPGMPAPADAQWTKVIQPDPLLLYRYSALTYNGHRIHYDRDYATQHEHYPALVVHGPLLSTLLCELVAMQLPDEQIKDFRFRALRPTFDSSAFTLCGRREGAGLEL